MPHELPPPTKPIGEQVQGYSQPQLLPVLETPASKWWAESKTILFNVATGALAVTAAVVGQLEPAMPVLSHILPAPATAALISVLCAANVVLRTVTSMGISFKQPDLPPPTATKPGEAP